MGHALTASSQSLLAPDADLLDAVIVWVDDDPAHAQPFVDRLVSAGFQVQVAHSGPQAKQLVFRRAPDLIVLSLRRADMDSFELCRQLKMSPPLRSLPAIFLTEQKDLTAKARAFRLGAADFVQDPADPEDLVLRTEHHVRAGRKLRELEKERAELLRENKELKKDKTPQPVVYTNPSDLPCGFPLDGKYRLDGRIGIGGFGVVYRATQLELQRQVAVKVFRTLGTQSTEDALKRFRQEGTSASRLNHPNAVAMLDSGIAPGGIPYLTMELLVGRTLADELRGHRQVSLARAIQIALPICDVLVEAHAIGLIHRDIKPENVFLHRARFGEVIKVLDFGIAKMLASEGEGAAERPVMTGAGGGIVGTPVYMAPERLRHGPYDGKSDVYSVGVVLYQMLCGHPPFSPDNKSFLEIVLSHLSDPAPPLRRWVPSLPVAIENLVLRTLEKDPACRPTARELLAELVDAVRATSDGLDRRESFLQVRSSDMRAASTSEAERRSESRRSPSLIVPSPSGRSSHSGVGGRLWLPPSGGSQPNPTADTMDNLLTDSGQHLPTANTMEIRLPRESDDEDVG